MNGEIRAHARGTVITWAEADRLARADAEEMDRRRTALAEREAAIHDSDSEGDGNG